MRKNMRNKSFNGIRPIQYMHCDEDKYFQMMKETTNNSNNNEDNNNEKYPYPNRKCPPSVDGTLRTPYGETAMK